MRTTALALGLCLALGAAAPAADPPALEDPRPLAGRGPRRGRQGSSAEKSEKADVVKVSNVTRPTLDRLPPRSGQRHRRLGRHLPRRRLFNILAIDHEGEHVARWLNSIGVTGIVLKYRVPRRPGTPGDVSPAPGPDGRPARRGLVRSKAPDLGLDPKRIGILGFSAGGHLAAWASTNPDKRAYEPVDDADKVDCRPDFTVLIYPAYLAQEGHRPARARDPGRLARRPPTFLAHAGDDPVTVESSVQLPTSPSSGPASPPSSTSTPPAATASA